MDASDETSDETGNETGLPASIEIAWGLRDRPVKGPRPGLTLGQIVDAGVRLARSEGLAAVSMSRVAGEIGVSTMALYRYVATKDELLQLMVDTAVGSPPEPRRGKGWRPGLTRWAEALLAAFRRHAWILRVPLAGPPTTPRQIAWMEAGLSCLRTAGLPESAKLSVVLLLIGYVRNVATQEADLADAAAESGVLPEQAMSAYRSLLVRLIDVERFPALHAVVTSEAFDRDEATDETDEFAFGLARILDGVEALVDSTR